MHVYVAPVGNSDVRFFSLSSFKLAVRNFRLLFYVPGLHECCSSTTSHE